MPRTITVTLDHDLGKDEARRRVSEGFDKLKGAMTGGAPLSFTEEWTNEDQLTFDARGLGQRAHGRIDVFPQHVRIEATLPTVIAALAEIVTGKVEKEGRLLLEKK
ncbi:MAG: polyhydroxyalkanoic acid system family protein [Parvularculaceae bacterium]